MKKCELIKNTYHWSILVIPFHMQMISGADLAFAGIHHLKRQHTTLGQIHFCHILVTKMLQYSSFLYFQHYWLALVKDRDLLSTRL